jgi:hypothetical protein
MKIRTVHILGVISLVEIIYSHQLGESVYIWILYGFYKLMIQ